MPGFLANRAPWLQDVCCHEAKNHETALIAVPAARRDCRGIENGRIERLTDYYDTASFFRR